MAEVRAGYRRKRAVVPRSPINFRMPVTLRQRLRRFAEDRGLGESDALRLVVSERLDEIESDRELLAAEKWQFKQAYADFQRILGGDDDVVGPGVIDKTFEKALTRARARAASKRK